MFASKHSLRSAIAALALALAAGHAAADTTLAVSIDTSAFGTSGWLDFQFNPASNGNALPATVTLSNFVGFDPAADVVTAGQVGGSLAAGYVIGNGDSWNDLFHAVQYGGRVLSFNVTFAGAGAPDASLATSVFSVSAYAADQTTPLGGSMDPSGALASITWTPADVAGGAGTVTPATYSVAASISAVPEPSSWMMLGIGAMLVAGATRRKAAPRLG
jgi:hypothetical protein